MMRRILMCVILLGSQTAQASNLFERFTYYHCGRPYYGYRAYAAPAQAKAQEYHAENYSRTINLTWHLHEPHAKQGNTLYGLGALDLAAYAGRIPNSAANLAEKLISVSEKTATDASSFDQQAISTQSVVLREVVANQRLQLLAQATEVKGEAAIVHHKSEPSTKPNQGQVGGTLADTEKACLDCHAADVADSKGNGNTLDSLAGLSTGQADIALEYITRTDANNCSKKANLSPEAQKELVKYLCRKSQ